MIKQLMLGTAAGALMVSAALAQSTPPSSSTPQAQPDTSQSGAPSQTFVSSQKPDQFLATNFKGTDVLGADNKKIGDVADILFDKSGKIEAFVISVGGVLGVGAKDVALAPTSFEIVAGDKSKGESDKLKLSMTQDQLKSAQNFEPYQPPRPTATTTGSGASLGGTGMKPGGASSPANGTR